MVAKIISGQDIKGALNYNEQKVMEGKATCLHANLFKNEAPHLSFFEKLNRFTDLNEKNTRTKTNTLHISLNFDTTENLDSNTLYQISTQYMDKIGFGDQPYLVYQHTDAAHPHLHIVTTIIQDNGKRIPIHFLGKNQSEKARKEIEQDFGLIQAQSKTRTQHESILPIEVQKVIYGKSETKRSIANIVRNIARTYNYTSLAELNTVLRQYNVTADRGSEKSKMFEKKGLLYSLIDDQGKRIGIPIKASTLPGKPTLLFLEKQFKLNTALRHPLKDPLLKKINSVLLTSHIASKNQFINELNKKGVTAVFRTNSEGRTYGLTFIDMQLRVVIKGSDLGKAYSANAILAHLQHKQNTHPTSKTRLPDHTLKPGTNSVDDTLHSALNDLLTATNEDWSNPENALGLNRKRRRKKSRRI